MSDRVLAPTRAEFKTLRECKNLGEAFNCPELMDRIKQSAPAHVKPARMLRTFIQAASRQPLLLQCNMRSVLGAMLTCTEVGLEPNTPLQHAFLIPFGKYRWDAAKRERVLEGYEVQLIFGYPGLLDLSYRSGHVVSVHADVVWPADVKDSDHWSFSYGTDAHLRHVPTGIHEDSQVPIWAYAHANLTQGQAFEVLPWTEVLRIRNGSQGYQSALRAKEAGEKASKPYIPTSWRDAPWVKFESQMARKTAFRALSKWLPKSVELAGALALDEQQDYGTVDFGSVIDGQASVMDGGLPDGGPAIDGDPIDGTATFTDRRQDGEADKLAAEKLAADKLAADNKSASDPKPARQSTRKQAAPAAATGAATTPAADKEAAPATSTATASTVDAGGHGSPELDQDAAKLAALGADPGPTIADLQPTFSEWLVDGEGVEIPDEDGVLEPITDPVKFAQAYVAALSAEFPGTRELMVKANHDALARAMAISTEVAPILNAGKEGAKPAAPTAAAATTPGLFPVDPAFIQIPSPIRLTKPVMEDFNKRLGELLGKADTPDAINHIIDMNMATYEAFSPSYRLSAKGLIEARQKAISPPPPRDGGDGDALQAIARDLAHDIYSLVSVASVDTWEKMPKVMAAMERLDRENPTLYAEVAQAMRERRVELTPPPPQTPEEMKTEMIAQALACKTVAEVVALGRRNTQYISDAKRLIEQAPALWEDVKAAVEKHQAELTAAGAI